MKKSKIWYQKFLYYAFCSVPNIVDRTRYVILVYKKQFKITMQKDGSREFWRRRANWKYWGFNPTSFSDQSPVYVTCMFLLRICSVRRWFILFCCVCEVVQVDFYTFTVDRIHVGLTGIILVLSYFFSSCVFVSSWPMWSFKERKKVFVR